MQSWEAKGSRRGLSGWKEKGDWVTVIRNTCLFVSSHDRSTRLFVHHWSNADAEPVTFKRCNHDGMTLYCSMHI